MKLTVASTFPIYPARGGGQNRILGLYRALAARGVAVDVVSLVDEDSRGGIRALAPGLHEVRVPKSADHHAAESQLHRASGVAVTDVAMALHHALTPAFSSALATAAADSDFVVASHPFTQPAIADACDVPLIYEAHNVELDLKAAMSDHAELIETVERVERACVEAAVKVVVCSADDARRLGELYGLDPAAAAVVPNGVDPAAVAFTTTAARAAAKRRLGIEAFQALFLGSWHEPNLAAVRDVLAAAEALPEVRFLVVGSAGVPFAREPVPANVDLCGVVEDGFVGAVLSVADAALNPMRFGSGTNLKMLDYALAGVPLVSTRFGARGLGLEPGVHYLPTEADRLAEAIRALRADDPSARVAAAREHVRASFAWDVVAASYHEALLAGVPA